jgi:hypothetical protein
MTWCARCDVLTTVSAGDPCPACGVPALDAAPVSGRSRSPIQVLELEDAPIIRIPETDSETANTSVEPSAPMTRRSVLSRLRRHSRLITLALAAVIIGSVYLGTRPHLREGSNATPTATPSDPPAAAPVLGEPANGWAVFALEHQFTLIDLATGAEHSIEVAGSIMDFAPSPKGGHIAYADEARVLYVTTAQGQAPVTLATEVSSFSWTPDGDALVVGRSQTDGRGGERMRIELISLADRTPLLLMESQWFAGPVISSGFTHLVTLYEGDTPSVFDLQPGSKPRLIRKNAALLDASIDGRRALLATNNGQRLIMFDMKTKKARRIGPEIFLTSAAKFSPDGRTAAVNGTSHFKLEESHCEGPEATCTLYPYPTDQTLWSLDVKTLELRSIRSWPSPEFASAPVWGPNGWVFMADSQRPVAYFMTDPSKPSVEFMTDTGIGTPPKYLA